MKSTDKAVKVSAQTTRTKFDGVLLTIRSGKSFRVLGPIRSCNEWLEGFPVYRLRQIAL